MLDNISLIKIEMNEVVNQLANQINELNSWCDRWL